MSSATSSLLRRQQRSSIRSWHLFDGTGQIIGRVAQRIATLLQGKHLPSYRPNVDEGDHVTLVNAEKMRFTGQRMKRKVYTYHSGFPGGLKEIPASVMMERHPTHLIRHAVEGMLPRNRFKVERMRRFRVYVGPDHPHKAQFENVDGIAVIDKLNREADERLTAAVAHPDMLPIHRYEDVGTKILPPDPEMRKIWTELRAKEEEEYAQMKAREAKAEEEEMKSYAVQVKKKEKLIGSKFPYIPTSLRDTKLGFLPKQKDLLKAIEKQRGPITGEISDKESKEASDKKSKDASAAPIRKGK